MNGLLWLIPVLPFAGAAINGLAHLHASWRTAPAEEQDPHHAGHATAGPHVGLPAPVVGVIAMLGPVAAFVLSVLAVREVHGSEGPLATMFSWIRAGAVSIDVGLRVDALTGVMLLVVTGIGSLIHLYAYGYMHEDAGFGRFMAYLNLFLAAMLVLVLGDSLPLMFVGWEGVGLCSYLLIGFWYGDGENPDAGRKAFIVNRVGDAAFILGMSTLFALAGTLQFSGLEQTLGHANLDAVLGAGPFSGWTVGAVMTFATACLFFGATGKSAQIPLHVWLPDAMAGPTPVSGLIHAATMVTAGVYLLARLNFLFLQTPVVLEVVGLVAATTALLAGGIAVVQNDIKKILAYSTVSQLGFMFAGVAATAFASGMFHVVTHAFFKALLFLGAGAVIHALHGEQDIRKMGGLIKDLRLITILFLIGSLALAGVPPFAGFWSKDAVLAAVIARDGVSWEIVRWMLLAAAGLTAFYTTRLVIVAFFGKPADDHRHLHPVHWTMTSVLVVLAALSVVGGALGGPLESYTHGIWATAGGHAGDAHGGGHDAAHAAHNIAMISSVIVATLGILAAVVRYGLRPGGETPAVLRPVEAAAQDLFFWDRAYGWLVVGIGQLAQLLFTGVDRAVIDRTFVEGSGKVVLGAGGALRRAQIGAVSGATAGIALGALLLGGIVLGMVLGG